MRKHSLLSHFSPDLIISSWRNGIKLIPLRHDNHQTHCSVANLMNMPFNVYFKSTESIMLAVNPLTEATCGPAGTVCGSWSKDINNQILLNDKSILKAQQKNIFIEEGPCVEDAPIQALSFKFPWYSKSNELIGLLGCTMVVNSQADNTLVQQFPSLIQTGILNQESTSLNKQLTKPKLVIVHPSLSNREKECLYYLIRGKTSKEIANICDLSYRTVEGYLNNVKIKLNVANKSQLIEKTLEFYTTYYSE